MKEEPSLTLGLVLRNFFLGFKAFIFYLNEVCDNLS